MKATIVTIGDEILIGQIIDTNSSYIAKALDKIGIATHEMLSISDDKEHILNTFQKLQNTVEVVIITGGLGPTKDDITKKTLCKYFNTHLIFNDEVYSDIERLFKERGYQVSAVNRSQAELPANCMALRNAVGTAAGMWFNMDGVLYVSMPGVPYEMMHLMESSILPMLSQQFNAPYIMHHTLLTQGIGESILAEKIHDWEEALPEGVKLAYLPSVSAVRLRLSGSGEDQEKLKNEFDAQLLKLKALVGKYCYGENNDTLESVLGQLLRAQNKTLATAESCTGGQIAASITKVPGCSNYFKGGVIAYSNDVKVNQLNVFQSDLDAYGAVSKPVVESMAKGVIKLLDVDYAIATSGVAGPDGGSVEKPVGTVWIAVASRTEVYAQQFLFGKHRERNIQAATLTALNLMRRMLQGALDVADYSVK